MAKPLAPIIVLLLACAPVLAANETRPGELDPSAVVERLPSMPERGASMETVHARLGAPEERLGPVGEPPITRWVYPRFTVYFEHDRVLHSVKRDD